MIEQMEVVTEQADGGGTVADKPTDTIPAPTYNIAFTYAEGLRLAVGIATLYTILRDQQLFESLYHLSVLDSADLGALFQPHENITAGTEVEITVDAETTERAAAKLRELGLRIVNTFEPATEQAIAA